MRLITPRLILYMGFLLAAGCGQLCTREVVLEGFYPSPYFDEQVVTFRMEPGVTVRINAPAAEAFRAGRPVGLILYPLPNGNTIEWTAGRQKQPGDDWHVDIQHIAAQVRLLRATVREFNPVVVYLQADGLSWPAWRREYSDHSHHLLRIVERLRNIFREHDPFLILSGHSGGGSFVFRLLESYGKEIPAEVERIIFLDSNYGYQREHGPLFSQWLQASTGNHLVVMAYHDSAALYQGKRIVSDTGGTWVRSRMMREDLARDFDFGRQEDSALIVYRTADHQIAFNLKKNPDRRIWHTEQVENNGLIAGVLTGTRYEERGYRYFGPRAYGEWIHMAVPEIEPPRIPPRSSQAMGGHAFMALVDGLPFEEREQAIYAQVAEGNIPEFLRQTVELELRAADSEGQEHSCRYRVLPDYLAIGSDKDFVRVPMGPRTAQRIADLLGMSLPTAQLVDHIYRQAEGKLEPVTYYPQGSENEQVHKFVEHSAAIEEQCRQQGIPPGSLIAGTKKDVVLSNRIADPQRPGHVVIYGWHRPGSGEAIQPLTNVHIDTYVDYSHGVRLVSGTVLLDGEPVPMAEILQDPVLYRLLSGEEGPMHPAAYPAR